MQEGTPFRDGHPPPFQGRQADRTRLLSPSVINVASGFAPRVRGGRAGAEASNPLAVRRIASPVRVLGTEARSPPAVPDSE
ncbi:hypothetical protein [Streptomyces sp. NPDC006012]|uniref:hypothetical protein n=1 Tax=Streptomyces sp. NPDC006012 TaxID=3364739 RepID=UPI0036AC799F